MVEVNLDYFFLSCFNAPNKSIGRSRLISFFCLELAFWLFCAHAGDKFIVKDECYLPLFENYKEARSFERGKKGCNCYDLDTTLLPGSIVEVSSYENGVATVKCEMTGKVKHKGFVYTFSVEDFCKKFEKGDVKRKRSPMSLDEIRSVFERCLRESVPYCWGGNQFGNVSLQGVTFTSEKKGEQYECRGFDCSGLLYYFSDGTLPHATGALKDFGKRLFTIEAGRIWDEAFTKEVEKVIADLKDTDFIAIKGHVIVAYNKGLIEFRSKDLGCCFTPQEGSIQRIQELFEAVQKESSDVWFVRWHPEYLQ